MNPTPNTASAKRFQVLEISLELIANIRNAYESIRSQDPDLARQLRRAASSIALNLGEGQRRRGRDRNHHYRIAAGSALETKVALRIAVAWGAADENECREALRDLDRILAMTWKLTEG